MFDVNADPSVVTATIERDLAEARRESEFARDDGDEVVSCGADPSVQETQAVESLPPAPPVPPPADAEAAYRRGRLGVVTVIVLVLLWFWIKQRRVG